MLRKIIFAILICFQLVIPSANAQNQLVSYIQSPLLENPFADFQTASFFRNQELSDQYYELLVSWNPDDLPEGKEDNLKKLQKKLKRSLERALKAVQSDRQLFSSYLKIVNQIFDDVYQAGYLHGLDSIERMELLIMLMEMTRQDLLTEKRLSVKRDIDQELFLKKWMFVFERLRPYMDRVDPLVRKEFGFHLIGRYFVVMRKKDLAEEVEEFEATPYGFVFFQDSEGNKDLGFPVFSRFQKYFYKVEAFQRMVTEGILFEQSEDSENKKKLFSDFVFFYSLIKQEYFSNQMLKKIINPESSVARFLGSSDYLNEEKLGVLFYFIRKPFLADLQKADLTELTSYLVRFDRAKGEKFFSSSDNASKSSEADCLSSKSA